MSGAGIGGGFLALALLCTMAADPPPPPHGPPPPKPGPAVTVLHLQQMAEESVVPDQLHIEMRAERSGSDPRSVQSAINRQMAAALAAARRVAGITVETGNYALFQESPPDAPPRWRGNQSLILVGKDAQGMLKLVGELQSGGLVMSSFAYQVSHEMLRDAEQKLTAEALTALDRRAAMIADRLHMTVSRYRDLTVGNAEAGVQPILFGAAMQAKAAAAPVAAPGRERIRLTVAAELALAPQHP
jgi:predicted secreted protein